MTERRFPPPWSVDDPDTKLGQDCYNVRDADNHALAYVYFEDEPGRRSVAHLLTATPRGATAVIVGEPESCWGVLIGLAWTSACRGMVWRTPERRGGLAAKSARRT